MTRKESMGAKKCPFCGGGAVIVEYYAGYFVTCGKCKARTATFKKESEALAVWESRVENAGVKDGMDVGE